MQLNALVSRFAEVSKKNVNNKLSLALKEPQLKHELSKLSELT